MIVLAVKTREDKIMSMRQEIVDGVPLGRMAPAAMMDPTPYLAE